MKITSDKITRFVERLKKIGIDVKLSGNFPWVYIDEICVFDLGSKTISLTPSTLIREEPEYKFKFTLTTEMANSPQICLNLG